MYDIIQKKVIKGSIKRSNKTDKKIILNSQRSDSKGITILTNLKYGKGSCLKPIPVY